MEESVGASSLRNVLSRADEPHGDTLAGFVASLTPEQRRRLADLRTFGLSRLPFSDGVNISTVGTSAYSTVGILLPIL